MDNLDDSQPNLDESDAEGRRRPSPYPRTPWPHAGRKPPTRYKHFDSSSPSVSFAVYCTFCFSLFYLLLSPFKIPMVAIGTSWKPSVTEGPFHPPNHVWFPPPPPKRGPVVWVHRWNAGISSLEAPKMSRSSADGDKPGLITTRTRPHSAWYSIPFPPPVYRLLTSPPVSLSSSSRC